MLEFQSLLITYNYTLILSRNLYFDNYTIYSGLLYKHEIACTLAENRILSGLRFIETIQAMKIAEIIADTNFIHATYRRAGFNVKPCSRKMRLLANKKGRFNSPD